LTLGYVDGDALPFRQAHDAGTLERRGVHEDILSALIRSDKAETLIGVVPLHRAQFFDGAAVARRICRSLRPRTSRRLLRRGAGIHADDLGHLRPLRSWAGTHLKGRARRYAIVAAAFNHAYMQEGIAGAIRELHEAEPPLRIVPFDGGADWMDLQVFRTGARSAGQIRNYASAVRSCRRRNSGGGSDENPCSCCSRPLPREL